jgi:hypothetical protein
LQNAHAAHTHAAAAAEETQRCLPFLTRSDNTQVGKKTTHSVETCGINPYIRNRKMPQTSALVFSKISKKRSYNKELMHTHMLQQQWKHRGACIPSQDMYQHSKDKKNPFNSIP